MGLGAETEEEGEAVTREKRKTEWNSATRRMEDVGEGENQPVGNLPLTKKEKAHLLYRDEVFLPSQ